MEIYERHKRYNIEKGRHLYAEERTVKGKHALHWHSYFEIELILSGKGKYVINDVGYDIEKHHMFFLSPTDFHYLLVEEDARLIHLAFDETVMDGKDLSRIFSVTKKAFVFSPEGYEAFLSAARLLIEESKEEGEAAFRLLSYFLSRIFRESAAEAAADDKHYKGIRKAIVYMDVHFKEKITLATLAAEAGYHPTYFSELFKKVTGETYTQTLTKLRIGYARTLLSGGLSVSDACFLSGFGSLSGFLSVFKKHCGMPPSEYRARQMAKKK